MIATTLVMLTDYLQHLAQSSAVLQHLAQPSASLQHLAQVSALAQAVFLAQHEPVLAQPIANKAATATNTASIVVFILFYFLFCF